MNRERRTSRQMDGSACCRQHGVPGPGTGPSGAQRRSSGPSGDLQRTTFVIVIAATFVIVITATAINITTAVVVVWAWRASG